MDYDFEWDPQKARANREKHGVGFEPAAEVFRDPRAVSLYDDSHSADEDRWITMGLAGAGGVLVVHHTFLEIGTQRIRIRIISCRKATRREILQYGSEP